MSLISASIAVTNSRSYAVVLAFIIVIALVLRVIAALQPFRGLDPDANTYFYLSKGILGGKYASLREPLHPLVGAIFLSLLGPSELSLRTSTVFVGVLQVLMVALFASRAFNRQVGVVSALLVGVNHYYAFNASRGLREELAGVLFIAFLYVAVAERRWNLKNGLVAGFIGSLLLLTKIEAWFTAVIPVAVYVVWRWMTGERRLPLRFLLAMLSVASLLQVAFFSYEAFTVGDPFATVKYHAYNTEQDPAFLAQILTYTTPSKMTLLLSLGAERVVSYSVGKFFPLEILSLTLIGSILLIRRQSKLYVPFLTLMVVAFWSPLAGLPASIDFRYLMPYLPLAISASVYALFALHGFLKGWCPELRLTLWRGVSLPVYSWLIVPIYVVFSLLVYLGKFLRIFGLI